VTDSGQEFRRQGIPGTARIPGTVREFRSSFRVTRCFNDCQAAIIEVEAPASGNDPTRSPLKHYMHVDRCLEMLAYSVVGGLDDGLPLGTM
jgi:hypothetical protein